MACDSVRRLHVRWCGQLVGCSGSGRGELMSLRRTSPDTQELAGREGMKGGRRPRLGSVIPWDRKEPGDFRGREQAQHGQL